MKHLTAWTLAALALLIGPATSQLGPNGVLPIGPGGGAPTSAKGIITACGASNNQLLWDSSGSCAGLATANNATLITSGAGVPSISATLPTAVQGNITSLGTVTSGTFNGALTPGTTTLTGGAANQLLYDNGGTLTETATLPFGITMNSTTSNGGAYVNTSNHLPTSVGTTKQTVIAGNQDLDGSPTLTADGQAWIYNGAGNGMQLQGRGSSTDLILQNRGASAVCDVPTNTQNWRCYNLVLFTSNGDLAIGRNAAGVLEINNGTLGTFRDITLRNITSSGSETVTGTTAPASAAGQSVIVGTIAAPTLANNGQAWLFNTSTNGAVLEGQGSLNDIAFLNKNGSAICAAPTGTANLSCQGNVTAAGTISTTSTTDATSTSTGAMQNTGGMSVNKRVWMNGLTTSGSAQTNNICQSSGGELIADSVACLASSERFKTVLGDLESGAVDKLMRLPMKRWRYNAEGIFESDSWTRERIGPVAEDVAAIDERLVGYGSDGKVRTFSTEQLLALAIKAIQEQQSEIEELRQRVK